MGEIFNEILYRPIFNFLIFIYNLIPGHDFGWAIIVLTIVVRLIFMPWSIKAIKSQRAMTAIQPKVKEVQEKFKHDKTAQAQALMSLYKENHVNPAAGCLPLLIQLPFLFALYRAFLNGFKPESLGIIYGFIGRPEMINNIAFGFLDLTVKYPFLAVIAGLLQFIQSKLTLPAKTSQTPPLKKEQEIIPNMAAMNKQILYFFPFMIIIIGWNLPAGLVLYWVVSTLFSIFEQFYIRRVKNTNQKTAS